MEKNAGERSRHGGKSESNGLDRPSTKVDGLDIEGLRPEPWREHDLQSGLVKQRGSLRLRIQNCNRCAIQLENA